MTKNSLYHIIWILSIICASCAQNEPEVVYNALNTEHVSSGSRYDYDNDSLYRFPVVGDSLYRLPATVDSLNVYNVGADILPDSVIEDISHKCEYITKLYYENLRSHLPSDQLNALVAKYEERLLPILEPLIAQGEKLHKKALKESRVIEMRAQLPDNKGGKLYPYVLSNEEHNSLNKLTKRDYAELYINTATIYNHFYGTEKVITIPFIDNSNNELPKWIFCLGDALGINSLLELNDYINLYIAGTKMLLNAKTIGRIALAMGVRYAGIMGLAISLASYAHCMSSE